MLLVGSSIAVFAYDHTALTESWNIPLGGALNIQFSPDGGTFYFVNGGDAVHVLDTVNGELITQLRAEDQSLWSLARSPDGKTLLAGSAQGDVLSWDLGEPTEPERRNAASSGIQAIDYAR